MVGEGRRRVGQWRGRWAEGEDGLAYHALIFIQGQNQHMPVLAIVVDKGAVLLQDGADGGGVLFPGGRRGRDGHAAITGLEGRLGRKAKRG